jgi:hypothetical protein
MVCLTSVQVDFPIPRNSKEMPGRAGPAKLDQNYQLGAHFVRRGLAAGMWPSHSCRIARPLLQRAVVAVLLIIHSRNMVSAVIRTALAFFYRVAYLFLPGWSNLTNKQAVRGN